MALEPNAPTTLLLGGGYTLQKLASLLEMKKFVITSRSTEKVEQFRKQGWLVAQADNNDPASLDAIFATYPTIVEVIDSIPPIAGNTPSRGVTLAASVFKSRDVRRVIYLSTTGVYGVRDGSWVDEDTECRPWTPPGIARLACEHEYKKCGFALTSMRLSAIYGPGRDTVTSLRQGRYRLVEDGTKWTNRIHVSDLAAILKRVLETEYTSPILCVADDEPVQARVLVDYLCSKFHLPYPQGVTEDSLIQSGAFTMLSNQRVQNSKMKSELHITLSHPTYRSMTLTEL